MEQDLLHSDLPDDQPVLTIGHLRRLEAVAAAKEAAAAEATKQASEATEQAEEIREQLKFVQRLLHSVEPLPALVPHPLADRIDSPGSGTGNARPKRRRPSYRPSHRSEIQRTLERSTHGFLSYDALRNALARGPLKKRGSYSEKTFHGALARLESSGVIQRHNGHAFLRAAYEAHLEAVVQGTAEEVQAAEPQRASPLADAILEVVKQADEALTSSQILVRMSQFHPDLAAPLKRHRTGLLNVLKRFVDRGVLARDGDEGLRTYHFVGEDAPRDIGSGGEPVVARGSRS